MVRSSLAGSTTLQTSPRDGLGSTPDRRHSLNLQAENVLPIRPDRNVIHPPARTEESVRSDYRWNTRVRTSMLSRGGAPADAVGSMNALCGVKRAGTLVAVS